MKKHKMDEWLKNSLGDHASELPAGGWKGLQASKKAKKRKPVIGLIIAVAASFASLGLVFFPGHRTEIALNERITLNGDGTTLSQPAFQEERGALKSDKHASAEAIATPEHKEDQSGANGSWQLASPGEPTRLVVLPDGTEITPQPHGAAGISATPEAIDIHSMPVEKITATHAVAQPKPVAPFKTKRPSPLFASFYLESRTEYGKLQMREYSQGMIVHPAAVDPGQYDELFNRSDLSMVSQTFTTGITLQRNKLSLTFGMGFRYTEFRGYYDYNRLEPPAFLGSGLKPIDIFDEEVRKNNGMVKAEYKGWDLVMPLRVEYRFRNTAFSPYVGAGVQVAQNISARGRVINPATLESEPFGRGYTTPFSVQWTLIAGYRIPLKNHNLNVAYTWSPFSTRFTPANGRMGANMHGITFTFEMP